SELEREFGWSRTQVMLGVSISNGIGVFLNILAGLLADRIGPRKVGLAGVVIFCAVFASFGTATGTTTNWLVLWGLLALGIVLIQAPIWTSAVAARFDHSRGFAMAVVLSGTSITALVVPVLATWLIDLHGWRLAFAGVAGTWALAGLPILFLLFHDGRSARKRGEAAAPAPVLAGFTFSEGIRTRAFICLIVSFGAFSFYNMSIATNIVRLLAETGISDMQAAGIASALGLAGITGRLSVGFLLDRFSAPTIGFFSQMLPVLACAILLTDAPGVAALTLAVVLFGFATGAEVDVALYLATRHFGLKAYAALFGAIITFGAINAAISPAVAGMIHDRTGSYDGLLMAIMVVMTIGALAVAVIGRPRNDWGTGH
ncbi:MAG TPA: MFS transporter, partial [Novosphingobium sp.]|nr:MFS transporter [Novosphingobium sp.]